MIAQTPKASTLTLIRRTLIVTASTAVLLAAVGVGQSHAQNCWGAPTSTTTTTTTAR